MFSQRKLTLACGGQHQTTQQIAPFCKCLTQQTSFSTPNLNRELFWEGFWLPKSVKPLQPRQKNNTNINTAIEQPKQLAATFRPEPGKGGVPLEQQTRAYRKDGRVTPCVSYSTVADKWMNEWLNMLWNRTEGELQTSRFVRGTRNETQKKLGKNPDSKIELFHVSEGLNIIKMCYFMGSHPW